MLNNPPSRPFRIRPSVLPPRFAIVIVIPPPHHHHHRSHHDDREPGLSETPSFAPPSTDMLQIVDFEDNFNPSLDAFLYKRDFSPLSFHYYFAAILGAQS